ncbi:MAG TPA: hypothetical protein VGC97_22920 [Pyrinomonadaceae bacterium]|jgi:hypothetical protein
MNTEAKRTSIWGKISIICALAAVLFGVSGILTALFLNIEMVLFISVGLAVLLVVVGVLSGIVGLFISHAWVGLSLNVLIVILVFVFFLYIYIYSTCCAPPLR